uniref:Tc1-like transposase DDE domain-containing protein n=1 Tax=Hucho hucho TaxID=62062 RepID=A0A4W5KWW1_9TELE
MKSLVMQQNNYPKHRSKSTTEWLLQKKIRLLEWPSQSPDLNLIEMLWHDLKREVHTRHPKNNVELKQFCKED